MNTADPTKKPVPEQNLQSQPQPATPQTGLLKDLTRRQWIIGSLVVTALGGAGVITLEELIRNGYLPLGKLDHVEPTPEVIQRLAENARALMDIDNTSVQANFDAQQAREPIIVPKPANRKKKCCVDDRYQDEGETEGLAGVGVLLSPEELAREAAKEVDEAEEALRAGEESYTIEICPHAKCGAVARALQNEGVQNPTPEMIAARAERAGRNFERAIQAEINRGGLQDRVRVSVRMLPEEHFVQAEHHPAAIGVHYGDDMEMNSDRKTGAMVYNIKSVKDGILTAKIALSAHGMRHPAGNIQLPPNLVYRIVLEGTPDEVRRLGMEYQRELAKPENDDIRGHVRVVVWQRRRQDRR